MDIINYAKNIAAVLATASTIAYVSGYLAVRARAHTLGTDPAFKLVDEAYAFAGFRFLFLILIVLLLSSPVIVGLRALLMWLMRQLPGEMVPIVHWIGLVAVAATTIALLAVVLTTNGVLLDRPCAGASYSTMEEAVLGMRPTGMLLFFVISVITALSLLWLHSLLPLKEHLLAWILTLVVAIQLVILPILHGALHADRKVRLLVEAPEKIKHLGLPLGIVDRTSEYVTIMGCDVNGGRQLVNLKLDDINGIPIKKSSL